MDEFIQVFGEVSLGEAALVVSAVVFLWRLYRIAKKRMIERFTEEQEKEKRVKVALEQATHYPEWRQQSIDIRTALCEAIEKIQQAQALNADKLENVMRHIYESEATTCRYRILRFNDEVLHDQHHTKEHFDQILDDITRYERYCADHPEYENNKAVFAIANIKRVYQKCADENIFL